MPANLREPVSLLTGAEEAHAKNCIPPSKISNQKCGRNKVEQVRFTLFWRVAHFAMNGRSPEENSLKLILCRLLAWARSPPRQQKDKAFVTSFDITWGLENCARDGLCMTM